MHAYLITGGTQELRLGKIEDLTTSFGASAFDRRVLTTPEDQPSITVGLIREWIRSLSFVGTRNHPLIGIIPDAHRMTPEAQNALLKTLEEPPGEVKILIETDRIDSLLPTISSRTITISLGNQLNGEKPTWEKPTSLGAIIQIGQTKGKTKEDALGFMTESILTIHASFLTHPTKESAVLMKQCLTGIRMLSVNVSPLSAIEHALFSSHSK